MKEATKVTFEGTPWSDANSISLLPAFWGKPGVTPSRKAWRDLERLLLEMDALGLPEDYGLLPNYPNPANPETWIPYELKHASEVVICIYDISGQLVKNINLRQRQAGYYISRDKAAYWDGRNTNGELVSSGIYFYTIKADDFTATRKLVLMR